MRWLSCMTGATVNSDCDNMFSGGSCYERMCVCSVIPQGEVEIRLKQSKINIKCFMPDQGKY